MFDSKFAGQQGTTVALSPVHAANVSMTSIVPLHLHPTQLSVITAQVAEKTSSPRRVPSLGSVLEILSGCGLWNAVSFAFRRTSRTVHGFAHSAIAKAHFRFSADSMSRDRIVSQHLLRRRHVAVSAGRIKVSLCLRRSRRYQNA